MDISPNSIEYLILEGAAEIAGIDLETGEAMYTFTDKLEEINPRLFKEINNYVYGATMSLWTKGFLDINLHSEDPVVKLTEKALDPESRKELGQREQLALDNIIRLFSKDSTL